MSEFETRAFQHGPLRFTALAQGSVPDQAALAAVVASLS